MEDGAGERSAICLHEAIALMSSLEDKELRRYLVSAFFLNGRVWMLMRGYRRSGDGVSRASSTISIPDRRLLEHEIDGE